MSDYPEPPDYKRLFEASQRLLVVLTPDLKVVAGSDAYFKAMGLGREEMLGRYIFDIFPDNPSRKGESTSSRFRASFMRVLQYRRPDVIPVERHDIPRPEAAGGGFDERYWSTISTPILNDAGEVEWIIVLAEDVTERVMLERQGTAQVEYAKHQQEMIDQLRNTSQYLDALIEHLPGVLFVKSYPDFRYTSINRATEVMLGRTRDQVLGKSVFDFYPVEEASKLMAADRATLEAENGQMTFEESLTTPAHGTRWLKTTKVAVRDKSGEPRYLLGFSQDITDQKAVEQQLRQALKMDAVGQLTGGIAHDFNNLLGVVIGNLDHVIETGEMNGDSALALGDALEAALRGSELTRRLLVFSRNQPKNHAVVDVNSGLTQTTNMIRRLLGGLITVNLRQATTLWLTRVDSAQLDEAILNMAINARDAMPKGGTITIETQNVDVDRAFAAANTGLKVGEYVLLTISDTGEGMSPETVERCFEPFFTTKATGKGTGLGLSMVYGFAKQSGGYIKVESKLGVGTTIGVYLPRTDADAPTEIVPASAPEVPVAENELILVVEDEHDLRKTTLRALTELGYRTLEAENGEVAIHMLAQNPHVDLLFTDVMMPGGLSGLDLARRARETYPHLEILLTSGFMGQLANGEDELPEILPKPFRKGDLAERVRSALGRD